MTRETLADVTEISTASSPVQNWLPKYIPTSATEIFIKFDTINDKTTLGFDYVEQDTHNNSQCVLSEKIETMSIFECDDDSHTVRIKFYYNGEAEMERTVKN